MKVFLSSTYIDLIEHRKAAHDALDRIELVKTFILFNLDWLTSDYVMLSEAKHLYD
jgi:hypothetical protein